MLSKEFKRIYKVPEHLVKVGKLLDKFTMLQCYSTSYSIGTKNAKFYVVYKDEWYKVVDASYVFNNFAIVTGKLIKQLPHLDQM